MTKGMDPPQAVTLEQRTQCPHAQGRQQERGPETHQLGDAVGEIGAQHVEAGMGEVEHAHHAENQRETGAQHEQQQPVADAVQ